MLSSNAVIHENKSRHFTVKFPDNSETNTDKMEIAAVGFVQKLGIRPNLTGYHLLIKAISLSLKSPELLKSLTKELYPKVAQACGKNVKSVERNIRKAIESAYDYDPARIQSIFYYKVDKPYISEVLSMAVETIRYEL